MNSLSNSAFCSSARVNSLHPYRRSLVSREKKGCSAFFRQPRAAKVGMPKKTTIRIVPYGTPANYSPVRERFGSGLPR